MTANPNAIPEHMRDMTDDDRKHIAEALDTVFTHLRDGTGQIIHETLQDEGWYGSCEDCHVYLSITELGDPCWECGHVNGDPWTGSTPDDIPMRVCKGCRHNLHHLCDGVGDPDGDEDLVFCNCERLNHPPVTVALPKYPRLRVYRKADFAGVGYPWVVATISGPEDTVGEAWNYFPVREDALDAAHGYAMEQLGEVAGR